MITIYMIIINYKLLLLYRLWLGNFFFTEDDEEEEEEEELQRAFSQHSEGESRTYINRFCRFFIFPLLALFYRSQILFAVCSIFGQLLKWPLDDKPRYTSYTFQKD